MQGAQHLEPLDAAGKIGAFEWSGDDWMARVRDAESCEPLESWKGYQVLSPAIRGGQASVYRCKRGDGRIVAVKRIHGGAGATPSAKRRMLLELQIAEALSHPGIVSGRTVPCDDEVLIESDWISGRSLIDWCREDDTGRPRDFRSIVEIFLEVCTAMEYAHQRGVIHRDLKPSNILIDGDGRVHILDFGLAGTLADFTGPRSQITLTEPLLGTPAYAAPEQVSGEMARVDVRSDIYSLGVLLYEALTGQSPYPTGLSLGRLLRAVEDHEPIRPRAIDGAIPRALEAVVLKALRKNPDERYTAVNELRADLDRFLQGAPTQARPPGLWFDLRAFFRRHPKAGWTAVSLAAIAISVVVVVSVAAIRLSHSQQATAMAHSAAERVNQLLGDVIGELAPPIDDGGAALAAQLDQTARRLDQEFVGEPWALARAHVAMGTLYAKAQRWSAADRHLNRGIDDYRALGDPDRAAVAQALRLLGLARAYQGLPDAIDRQDQAMAIAARLSASDSSALALHHAARAESLIALRGSAAKVEAEQDMKRALELLRGGSERFLAWEAELLSNYARAFLHAGLPNDALGHLLEASRLFEGAHMPLESCPYHRASANLLERAYEAMGDVEAAARIKVKLDAVRHSQTSNPPSTKGDTP